MKPSPFDYVKADSVRHAAGLLAQHDGRACLLAGGQSLVPNLNLRRAAPEVLIDINDLAELQGISVNDDSLLIGCGVRHGVLEGHELVRRHAPLFSAAVRHLGHMAVRNRGTVGGNLAYADPASELPACCMALNAELELCGSNGVRRVAARTFFEQAFVTARKTDEVITLVRIPLGGGEGSSVFRECARRFGGFALMGMAMHAAWRNQRVAALSAAFFGLGRAQRLAERAAALLIDTDLADAAIDAAAAGLADELEPLGDMHASAAYRAHLARHLFVQGLRAVRDGG